MSKRLKKQHKQKRVFDTETFFELFCTKNGIECIKLDSKERMSDRTLVLKKASGKCPDFWCKIDGKEIFVEVKTLTNLTNQKREESIERAADEIKAKGLLGEMTSEVFSPEPELVGPFTTFLKDASNKFKNIKDTIEAPRILFIDGFFGNIRFSAHSIFLGAYDSYKKEDTKLVYCGMKKTERGLFDKTGSNVSAVLWWNKEIDCFQGLENTKPKISLSKDIFNFFFKRN